MLALSKAYRIGAEGAASSNLLLISAAVSAPAGLLITFFLAGSLRCPKVWSPYGRGARLAVAFGWGTPLVNGLAITGGGLAFTGAMDSYLRAFDAKSGVELWQGRLPVPGIANPMTYNWRGEQYVLIAAGGHSEAGTSIGDSVFAFRLARPGEAPSLWSRTIDRPGGRFTASLALVACALLLLAVLRLWLR